MMIAKAITLALIPAGAAALGTVGYLQHHQPRALSAEQTVMVQEPLVRVVETPKVVTPPPAPVVVEPLVVKVPAAKPRIAQKAVAKLAPCTGWRNLGYDHVDNGKASGINRVRELCDPTATARK